MALNVLFITFLFTFKILILWKNSWCLIIYFFMGGWDFFFRAVWCSGIYGSHFRLCTEIIIKRFHFNLEYIFKVTGQKADLTSLSWWRRQQIGDKLRILSGVEGRTQGYQMLLTGLAKVIRLVQWTFCKSRKYHRFFYFQ